MGMVIAEEHVAAVVAEISAQLSDPAFAQERIGGFVDTQPNAARFLTLAVGRKLGPEEAMQAVFHATVLEACFHRTGVALAVATQLLGVADPRRAPGLPRRSVALDREGAVHGLAATGAANTSPG